MRSIVTSLSIVAALVAGGAMLSTAGAQDKGARTYSAERGKTAAKKKKAVRAAKTRKSRMATRTRAGRQAKAAPPQRVAGFARTQPGAAKQPGSCGTFMYWKDGSCADARNKK